jgi:hypothetical protein
MPQSIMANIMDGKWKTLENMPQSQPRPQRGRNTRETQSIMGDKTQHQRKTTKRIYNLVDIVAQVITQL